ncbi:MAG: cell division protein ZapB [Syntrophorhabdales bacterium]|jgi:hypothetical protein
MKASVCSAAGRIRQVALLFGIGFCCLLFVSAGLARAQTAATIESLQQQIEALKRSSDEQINALKQQIEALKATQEAQAAQVAKAAPPAAAAPAPAPSEPGTGKTMFANTDVRVTLGGYIAMTGIYRDRYTGSDSNSKWNIGSGGLPLPNSPNYYMDELRGSARATRLSLLAQGQEDYAALSAYTEIDFLGGAATSSANSQGTNGYYPRLRQAWAGYDTTTSGWHLLAGQAFTLLTLNREGIVARQEVLPMVVDNTYVPGFTYTRNPQVRLVKDFGNGVWVGMSLESPQAIVTAGGLSTTPPTGASNYSGALLGSGNAFYNVSTTNNSNLPTGGGTSSLSLDQYPDIAAKIAVDPGFGHYEGYVLGRAFTDRTLINGNRTNETSFGWGAGAAVLLPVVPKFVDFEASFLGGEGIGRYGAAGMYDAVVNPLTGELDPIREIQVLTGVVVHATSNLDLYSYAGLEKESRKDIYSARGVTGGFGAAAYGPIGLNIEGNSASSSLAQASSVGQIIFGGWYTFYKGKYGLMNVGVSDAYTRVQVFGIGGETLNTVMACLRYYPF